MPQLTQALTASLIGFAVGAFFLSLAYHEMLYTLVALSVGLGKVTSLEARDRVRKWRERRDVDHAVGNAILEHSHG